MKIFKLFLFLLIFTSCTLKPNITFQPASNKSQTQAANFKLNDSPTASTKKYLKRHKNLSKPTKETSEIITVIDHSNLVIPTQNAPEISTKKPIQALGPSSNFKISSSTLPQQAIDDGFTYVENLSIEDQQYGPALFTPVSAAYTYVTSILGSNIPYGNFTNFEYKIIDATKNKKQLIAKTSNGETATFTYGNLFEEAIYENVRGDSEPYIEKGIYLGSSKANSAFESLKSVQKKLNLSFQKIESNIQGSDSQIYSLSLSLSNESQINTNFVLPKSATLRILQDNILAISYPNSTTAYIESEGDNGSFSFAQTDQKSSNLALIAFSLSDDSENPQTIYTKAFYTSTDPKDDYKSSLMVNFATLDQNLKSEKLSLALQNLLYTVNQSNSDYEVFNSLTPGSNATLMIKKQQFSSLNQLPEILPGYFWSDLASIKKSGDHNIENYEFINQAKKFKLCFNLNEKKFSVENKSDNN